MIAFILLGFGTSAALAQFSPQRLLQRPRSTELNTSLESNSFNSTYTLNSGDQLEITVLGYEEYTGTKVILPDGTISLPLIGAVPVAGKTAAQVRDDLRQRLNAYLVEPTVTVNLLSLRPVIVTVSGAVMRPGPIELRGITAANAATGATPAITATTPATATNTPTATPATATATTSNNRTPTISSAIIAAGGIMRDADLRNVTIQRRNPDGSIITSPPINLWDAALSSEAMPMNMLLRDGDVVVVPRLATGDIANQREFARSALAPNTVRVRVVGEVKSPGEVQVPPNGSISSAIASAGGPTKDAKLSQVAFIRPDGSGQINPQILDLRKLSDTQQIQEGDLIVVPKQGIASVLDFVARLVAPLAIFSPFL
jgi:polysaccharide export outer membrane protein